jgi:hypothetical protein
MSSSTHFSDPSSFQQQSNSFISWLEGSPGVKVNSKILLADLRATGAGRGIGKFNFPPTTQNPQWSAKWFNRKAPSLTNMSSL